jgi:hypothetical protein
MDAGHGPWLVDPAHVAYLIEAHTQQASGACRSATASTVASGLR